jgi:hypothetical protein
MVTVPVVVLWMMVVGSGHIPFVEIIPVVITSPVNMSKLIPVIINPVRISLYYKTGRWIDNK